MHRKKQDLPVAFADLGIQPAFLAALKKMEFVEPSEIQQRLIPLVLEGKDVLAQARTGTGKTAAFGLPILQMIQVEGRLQAIVLVPTRELAVQVAAEMRRMAADQPLHVVPVYGGQRISHQVHLLGKKPHVVVGTPGRVMDLMGRGVLSFDSIRFVVLDEVDRMLDIGFRDDIRKILSKITTPHQTVFASATLTDEIKRLARQYMTDPVELQVSVDVLTVEEVAQSYVTVDPWDKFDALEALLVQEKPQLAIVFCNTKHATRRLAKRLQGAGLNVKEIHGDLVQEKRERVMDRFRKHKVQVLVATDLAARGIDVHGITHIINYDVPDDPHVYVHRIGRTARMGSFGKAITFVGRDQGKQLTEIELLINKQIPQEKIEGFTPRPPREAETTYDQELQPAGIQAAPEAPPPQPKPPARRLGAKFPTRRRRRL
ncbi:MAG TPA: DEAD/DEAH box helicase [Phycisphaerae bacterium]|nr:DEAD/DEAH box helicase [Phycisphaerae bacterium]HOJ75706.1 DEAD/DEAH box helicase [Phycisphaerae bacterium]HOM53153.1 DEAD/DEAH box helicase [Phycisphaerae bacterium]HOQ87491.1 DEAD/DEAH box helicase [Phycisphaerae bacterium]HPP28029.1 DEAD/DEAH box helicase [Phycisphaerae bacterium]